MPRIDPFFDRQPPFTFINELRSPMHVAPPADYGKRTVRPGEIVASGMYLVNDCPDELLRTSWEQFVHFLRIYNIEGNRFPVYVSLTETASAESFRAGITADGVQITGDREGIRRGLVWLEDELRRSEAPYLIPGVTERTAVIRSRITRCFFSPINRPPKFGDELSDDIDYYPDEYLNRLMHDGVNGVWVYTRFSDLVESPWLPDWGKGRAFRIGKLNRLIEKCARWGIGVYVFAIEPAALKPEQDAPALCGIDRCICVETEEGKAFVRDAGRRLLTAAPGLRGFISITYGERPTSCASMYKTGIDGGCPKFGNCIAKTPGQLLADNVESLRAGFRDVNPDCEVISWTYGHRIWEFDDIRDYVSKAPLDVMLMQNFDDMGYEEQLGVMRQCVDYWLSYVGPSELFTVTADAAKVHGRTLFAKMQVCCSHEIASVPYVPVPGILWKKYASAREWDVRGVMQCWYFGNYPSMMSKAAGELAFVEKYDDEDAFLTELAAIWWGQSLAPQVVRAWKCFEESYRNYPMNVMFSYYGPMHDSVVWKLWLEPKNLQLPRTWQTLDPIDGDRIGEALLNGHTLEEALSLLTVMCEKWTEGISLLPEIPADNQSAWEQHSVALAIGILFDGARNILEFYHLRDLLGRGIGDPTATLSRMETLVRGEIENSRRMMDIVSADGRLGYHSEGEGYKFFPEKLTDRIAQLETLLVTEFVRVKARIAEKLPPLAYYAGEGEGKRYTLVKTIDEAVWEPISQTARFRAAADELTLTLELWSDKRENFTICPEFKLLWPDTWVHLDADGNLSHSWASKLYFSLFGERADAELGKYANRVTVNGVHTIQLNLADFGVDTLRPMKLKLCAGREKWCTDPDPKPTLGKDEVIPGDYGWLIPLECTYAKGCTTVDLPAEQ